MALARTTTDLVASVRRRCFMKPSDPDFTTDDIIDMLNEQSGAYLMDLIRPYSQGFALQQFETPLVTQQADYNLPVRAVNGTIEAMGIVDPTGVAPGYRLVPYDPADAVLLQRVQSSQIPLAYQFMSNTVRLYPAPINPALPNNTLAFQAVQRPSQLVPVASVCTLTGALTNVTPTSYRVPISGTAPTTFTVGAEVELVSGQPGYSTFTPTGTILATGSGYVDVTGVAPEAPYTPRSGDYLCLYDQAPVITNIPPEFQEALLQWVAVKMMEAKGDVGAMDRMAKSLEVTVANLRHQLPKRNLGGYRFLSAWAGLRGLPVRGLLWPLANAGPNP